MKALAISHKGFEKECSDEIKELIKTKTSIKPQAIIFTIKNLNELCKVCYQSQSSTRILLLLDSFTFKTINNIKKQIKQQVEKQSLKDWLKKRTFVVRCLRLGEHKFSSHDLEAEIGEIIFEKYKNKVNLENPDITFYIFINNNQCYFGIDFCGFDLSKRDYKIFNHPTSLNGAFAFCMLRYANHKPKDILLDPFCGCGTIPIEATLYAAKKSSNFFRKDKLAFNKLHKYSFKDKENKKKFSIVGSDQSLSCLKASQKNAQIADIHKSLKFTRIDIEWLDTKFKKAEIDLIITHPPYISRTKTKKDIEKLYNEFFYQVEYILNNKGRIILLTKDINLIQQSAEKNKFKLTDSKEVWHGKERFEIVKLEKV